MKKFLGVYIGMADAREKSGWNKLEPAELEKRQGAGIEAWKGLDGEAPGRGGRVRRPAW